ncbi:unnamed protein product [marine sediment metagenome]|uniref:Uncharacterized protein n=1 Tax=marine sediment metagenome TaxID=412755 RepID=X1LF47_9ZZZZ
MPTVTKILRDACSEVILLSDNTAILQPKNSCDTKYKPDKNYLKDYIEVGEKTDRTVWLKTPLFTGVEVGTEIPLDFSTSIELPEATKEELKKEEQHLVDLKKQRAQLDEPSEEPSEKLSEKSSEKSSEEPSEPDSKD